jgi:hypothetical protein
MLSTLVSYLCQALDDLMLDMTTCEENGPHALARLTHNRGVILPFCGMQLETPLRVALSASSDLQRTHSMSFTCVWRMQGNANRLVDDDVSLHTAFRIRLQAKRMSMVVHSSIRAHFVG